MKKIKIAHIITKLELGGAQQNTLYTAEHLPRDRYEVFLISGCGGILDEEAKIIPDTKIYFIPWLVREINPIYDFLALLRLLRLIRLLRPEIIHTHSSKAGILGRWAAYLYNSELKITKYRPQPIKIIHTFHGFGFNPYQKWINRKFLILIEYFTAKFTDKLIAVSEDNIKTGLGNKIGTREKYILIHSGIKISRYKDIRTDLERTKREFDLQLEEKVVTMIAPFKTQKAPLDFIRVAKYVKEKLPSVKFILVGDGELRTNLQSAIGNRQLEKDIILLGWQRNIPEIMQITDIFVLTSLWEGLPRTILEAMASGKPVVATAVDGNREIVKDGITGFLVPPKEPKMIAEKIVFLLNNSELRKKMGEEGRKTINDSFDIDQMVAQLNQLYQDIFHLTP